MDTIDYEASLFLSSCDKLIMGKIGSIDNWFLASLIGCTTSRLVWRQMNLQWGVSPLLISEENTAEDLFREAVNAALEAGYVKKGDRVVLTAGIPLGISGKTNMLRVVEV